MFLEITLADKGAKIIKDTISQKNGSLLIEARDFPVYLKTFREGGKNFLSYKTVVLGKKGGIKVC